MDIHKLTNRDISNNYRDYEFWLMPSDFLGALAYWIASQNPNNTFVVDKPLKAFSAFINDAVFENPEVPVMLTYDKLSGIISEEVFQKIPEILELNEMKPDFVDLGALARNVFYMIARTQITQPL